FKRTNDLARAPGLQHGEDEVAGDATRENDSFGGGGRFFRGSGEIAEGPLASGGEIAQSDFPRAGARNLTPPIVQHCQLGSARLGSSASEYEPPGPGTSNIEH